MAAEWVFEMKLVLLDGYLANFEGNQLALGAEHQQQWYPATAPHEAAERIGDADGVIVNRQMVDDELMERCPNLKYIGALGTGYNMIDLAAATRRGIVVTNCPGYSTPAVAQATFGLLLDVMSRVSVYDQLVRTGGWKKGGAKALTAVSTHELAGKTMGILGLGEIGQAVATIAAAFGMEVLGYRRTPGDSTVPLVDLDTLLAKSDVLSIHCPLTAETTGLINRDTIAKMKDGAVIINTARGAILNEKDVAAALDSGKLAALGADVLTAEPPEETNPLVGHPKAVITPHVAWMPVEARQRLLKQVEENFLAFVAGSSQNVVNP